MILSFPARAAALLIAATCASPALAQVTIHPDDTVIQGDLTVQVPSTGAGNPIEGSLYVEDDSTIDASLCLGNSCSTSESFANEVTLRFRYTENAIEVIDTSSSSNPDRDWTLMFNDNDTATEMFAVRDDTQGTIPFTIVGGAPANAFWMAASGDIGLGTSIPQQDLHILANASPAIRLEQTGIDVLGEPRSWDILANNNFGISDVTAGTAPFGIEGAAPSFALRIETNGAIGMGTPNPAAALHVQRTDNTAQVLVEDTGSSGAQELFKLSNNGGSYFTFENTNAGTTWFFTHENSAPNRFIIADAVTDGPEFTLTAEGDLTIPGQLFTAGSCAAGCDRVFDADYPLPSIPEQAAMMRAKKHLPAVGPTPEDGPFNITAMTGGMLNELEKAHLYIAELHRVVTAQAGDKTALEAQLAAQDARIARLEAQIDALLARP